MKQRKASYRSYSHLKSRIISKYKLHFRIDISLKRHVIYIDYFVTLIGTASVTFDLENAPYLVIIAWTGGTEIWIELVCNKQAFIITG
jgi:hypothetical protein